MPVVFVHGVPETPEIWSAVVAVLGLDDPVLLRMPGFGGPLPDGFEPTMYRYADWLGAELDALDVPVDLVTHDWGALLAVRVLAERPARARSWVTDGPNLADDFRWHDLAQLWQTRGEGEAFMDGFVGATADERAAMLAASGVPEVAAGDMATSIDRTMADAILVLYRSATGIGLEWGPGTDRIDVPSLVVDAENDPYRRAGGVVTLADRLGARRAELPGCGHWWMLEDPATAAAAISSFWSTLD